jgi:hypothetical protein
MEASCGGGQTKRPEPETFVKNALDSVILDRYTAKTKCQKFETNIPRKGISGP